MPVNVIHFEHEGRARWGVARQGRIVPIPGVFSSTGAFVRAADVAALAALDVPSPARQRLGALLPEKPARTAASTWVGNTTPSSRRNEG